MILFEIFKCCYAISGHAMRWKLANENKEKSKRMIKFHLLVHQRHCEKYATAYTGWQFIGNNWKLSVRIFQPRINKGVSAPKRYKTVTLSHLCHPNCSFYIFMRRGLLYLDIKQSRKVRDWHHCIENDHDQPIREQDSTKVPKMPHGQISREPEYKLSTWSKFDHDDVISTSEWRHFY